MPSTLEIISRTVFFTSLVAYVVFWLADLFEPGFVSRYFSVHLFLLAAIISGFLWSRAMVEYEERPMTQLCGAIILGVIFSTLVWFACDGEVGYRILLTAVTFLSSIYIFKILNNQTI